MRFSPEPSQAEQPQFSQPFFTEGAPVIWSSLWPSSGSSLTDQHPSCAISYLSMTVLRLSSKSPFSDILGHLKYTAGVEAGCALVLETENYVVLPCSLKYVISIASNKPQELYWACTVSGLRLLCLIFGWSSLICVYLGLAVIAIYLFIYLFYIWQGGYSYFVFLLFIFKWCHQHFMS